LQIIRPEWVEQIESAKADIFEKLKDRLYPLNEYWLSWEPNPNWSLPRLPQNWAETSI
jgi:hypothetical protein